MSNLITEDDVPIQDKHPDWLEWFERNGIAYEEVRVLGLGYDWSSGEFFWRAARRPGEVGEWSDGKKRPLRPIIVKRKHVDGPPPWVLRGKVGADA